MRWNQGRAEVDQMLSDGKLGRVPPNREHADRLITQARRHLANAARERLDDPEGAYSTLYDAAYNALAAILANEGLRVTSYEGGGHKALYHAVRAQLVPPLGDKLWPFDRMRAQRNDIKYPSADAPYVDPRDVLADISAATAIVDLAATILDQMSPY
jgi:hypothetical protein